MRRGSRSYSLSIYRGAAVALVALLHISASNAATTTDERPLGSLINVPGTPAPQSRSVLPEGWLSRSPVVAPQPSRPPAPAETGTPSSDRPLGTLIRLPDAPRPAPASPAASQTPTAVPSIVPAARVVPPPATDASSNKPLGVLIDTTPPALPAISPAGDAAPTQIEPISPASRNAVGTGSSRTGAKDRSAPTRKADGKRPVGKTDAFGRKQAPKDPDAPVIPIRLSAAEMQYDKDNGTVTAVGNVDIRYGGRRLIADRVVYNQNTDIIVAEGNASLTDTNGKILFGDRFEITGDMKDGIAQNIGLLLADLSRVAATGARRSDGETTEMRNAVYSPCRLCEDDPSAAPMWQLKAVRVIHHGEEKIIEYRDAWLELFGYPVAYTPYLSHPDPTVRRKSGFLAPSFGNSTDLGFVTQIPYYWVIDDQSDVTFTPIYTSDAGSGGSAHYRLKHMSGKIDAKTSFVAADKDKDFQGHVDAEARFDISKTWRWGLDLERATDETYQRRYGYPTQSGILTSRAYMEGFRGTNYAAINTYSFQDLEAGVGRNETPTVLPLVDLNYAGKRDRFGGFTSIDFNALALTRYDGADTRRLAVRSRWDRPFSGAFGDIYNASVSLATDAYHASEYRLEDSSTTFSGFTGRVFPRAELEWRFPLVKPGERVSQNLEPIASVVLAPNGGNPDKIPNEDSQELEFDDTNLFRDNRYDGFDRVDGGVRFNYGIKWGIVGRKGGSTSLLIGQSYRPRTDTSFATVSGLEDNFSDIVTRFNLKPGRYIDLVHRSQFSPDNFTPKRNELAMSVGVPALRIGTNYIFVGQQQGSEFAGREQISNSVSSQINKNWRATFSSLNDLEASELRSLGLQLIYENECVIFTTQLTRTFFEDREIRPTDTVGFRLVLKTLGEVKSDVLQLQ